jgi:hypothetical protein
VISQGYNFENIRWMEACLRTNIPYAVITHAAMESA